MKLLGKVSGWARRGVLAVGALLMTLVALIATTATAHAGLDDELTLVDGKGRLLRIQQWDTFLNGVFPLDRNRLTREWFHSGRAVYEVTGAGSDAFEGTLELGYQVGYPWSLGVGLNFNYTTPNTSILYDVELVATVGTCIGIGGHGGPPKLASRETPLALYRLEC